MKRERKCFWYFTMFIFLVSGLGLGLSGEEDTFALKGALVHPVTSASIEGATILVKKGKIVALGKDISLPEGIRVVDVRGKEIIPGLVDPHSHIGVFAANDANELPQPIGPENRALDALHLDLPDWMEAVKGGVTTVVTGPGSGERMGGQSVTIKTFGKDLEKRILKESGELKMAVNGVNLSHIPTIQANFLKAREYLKKWERYEAEADKASPPERDLSLEALAKVLKGEEVLRVHVIWANDIISFLKMKDEFGFELQFIHAPEAWKVAEEIAKRKVGVICMPIILSINLPEDLLKGIVTLQRSGVKIAMHSDYPVAPEKWFRLNASLAIRYGLEKEEALKAITINPAEMAKVDTRVGSIEVGKDADLVVLNGPWYEISSTVEKVFVDGILAYDSLREEER